MLHINNLQKLSQWSSGESRRARPISAQWVRLSASIYNMRQKPWVDSRPTSTLHVDDPRVIKVFRTVSDVYNICIYTYECSVGTLFAPWCGHAVSPRRHHRGESHQLYQGQLAPSTLSRGKSSPNSQPRTMRCEKTTRVRRPQQQRRL